MFLNFLDELRSAGIPASLKEHLLLLEALDAGVIERVRVDGIDGPGEAVCDDIFHYESAERPGTSRGADEDDAPGKQQCGEIADGHAALDREPWSTLCGAGIVTEIHPEPFVESRMARASALPGHRPAAHPRDIAYPRCRAEPLGLHLAGPDANA